MHGRQVGLVPGCLPSCPRRRQSRPRNSRRAACLGGGWQPEGGGSPKNVCSNKKHYSLSAAFMNGRFRCRGAVQSVCVRVVRACAQCRGSSNVPGIGWVRVALEWQRWWARLVRARCYSRSEVSEATVTVCACCPRRVPASRYALRAGAVRQARVAWCACAVVCNLWHPRRSSAAEKKARACAVGCVCVCAVVCVCVRGRAAWVCGAQEVFQPVPSCASGVGVLQPAGLPREACRQWGRPKCRCQGGGGSAGQHKNSCPAQYEEQ